jgi:hypothetical protein
VADDVTNQFKRALEVRGGSVALSGDVAVVAYGKRRFEVSLDNLRRRIAGGEPIEAAVAAFVDLITAPADTGNADSQRDGLRLMLEQLVVVSDPNVSVRPISEWLGIVIVWTDSPESRIRFVGPQELADWSMSEADAWTDAAANMDALLAATPIEMKQVAGSVIAMLATASPFKASLVAAPSLRGHVSGQLGWPVLAVAPCRDFLYLFPNEGKDLLSRLGPVVMREFSTSPYPLSPEVFSVSDSGLRAVGSFSSERNE